MLRPGAVDVDEYPFTPEVLRANIQKRMRSPAFTPSFTPPAPQKVRRVGFDTGPQPETDAKAPTSFTFVKELGKGAYGTVNLVKGNDGKEYAQKALNMDDHATINEMDIMLRFIHPNIVRAVQAEARPPVAPEYLHNIELTMERADKDLQTWVRQLRQPLTNEQVLSMMYQILSAIHFMHSQGYYHCDIKPENILMFGNTPKVADLGLTFPFEYKQPFCGTPSYTSPQGLSADEYPNFNMSGEQVDYVQADIYSLGSVMFYLMTRRSMVHFTSDTKSFLHNYNQAERLVESQVQDALNDGDSMQAEMYGVVYHMIRQKQSLRYKTVLDVLQSKPFVSMNYSQPIGGIIKATKMTNQCSLLSAQEYSQNVDEIVRVVNKDATFDGNGLVLFIALTLFERCLPLYVKAKDKKDMREAVLFIAFGYLNEQLFDPSEESWKYIAAVINFVGGIIRVPSFYDIANSAEELKFVVRNISKDCNVLHMNPEKLLQMFASEATAKQRANKQSKREKIVF
jgi:serine/threonine protein kinase